MVFSMNYTTIRIVQENPGLTFEELAQCIYEDELLRKYLVENEKAKADEIKRNKSKPPGD